MAELHTILYVEDDPDIQAVARMALEAVGGFTVVLCSSGEQALDVARATQPDLILLDVMMPGMDGPAVLAMLHAADDLRHIPVAFMTAKIQPAEIEHYIALGAIDVITKPFDAMTLASTVRTIFQEHQDRTSGG